MSLSRNPTLGLLRTRFVCGVRNIEGAPWAGVSGQHGSDGAAIIPRNGAGPHNLQLFVLDPDGTVLHCLQGYWNSNDLAFELEFAARLDALWHDRALTRIDKLAAFSRMHREHAALHPPDMVARSVMERFDMRYELTRQPPSDTLRAGAPVVPDTLDPAWFKTTDVIAHERMAARPFQPYAQFDVAGFSDYGSWRYDIDTER